MGIYNTPVLPVSRCAAGAAAIVPAASTTASTTVQCFFNLYDLSRFTISSPAPSVCSLRSSIVRVTNFKCNRISLLLSLSSSSSSVLLKSGSSPFFRSCCFRTSRNIEERLACKMNQVDGNFVSSNLESGNMIFEPILEEGVFRFDCTSNDRIAAFPSLSFVNPKARDTPIKSHKVPSYIPTFERVLGQQVYQIQLPFGTSFYGTGEVSGQLERTGKRVFTWNSDAWGYGPGTTSLYQSHPWVLAVLPNGEALGVLVDTTRRCEIDLRKQSTMKFVTPSSCPIITFGPFGSPTDVLVSLSHAVGTVFMPPKWSLGYHQCRWSYMSDKRVLEVARKFRERGIPCDVIWMDIDYMDGFRCFTFDHERFPDPKCLVKELQHNGIKAIWMLDPGIKQEKGYFVYDSGSESEVWIKTADGRPFVGDVWPGPCVFPDFTQSKARSWWANLVKDFVSNGVDGIWNDMNEPSVFKVVTKTMPESNVHFGDPDLGGFQNHSHYHNVYGMLMARSTYEGMKLANENKRPFVLTRAGFIGSQRYAATWTGDNLSTWEHLHMSISMVLQLGLSGQPLSGPDIGGFAGNATPKLFGRWMGIGAMFPFCRGHSEAGTIDHEPWSFGEECEEVCRLALKRRYRLMPHLYTLFYMAHTKGTPVAAPIFFADSKDSSLRANESSFLLGPLLICASTMQNQGVHQIQHVLPKGIWLKFDFEDSHPDLPALYLQGGSILPLGPPHEHVGEANPEDDLTLLVAFDEHGKAEGVLFEDDGDGYKFTKGGYLLTYYVAELQSQVVTIKVTETKGSWKRPKRRLHVKLLLGEGAMIDSWGTDGELVQMMMPTEHEISKLVSISTENFKKRIGNQHSGIRTLHYSVRKMEDDGDGRRDVGWKYAFLGDPNNKNDVTCKFCQKVAKGGIYRLKQHLAGGYRNIKACNKCPEHIRQEIIEYMAKKKSERDQMNLLHEPDKITDLEEEETEFFMANDPRGKRPMSAVVSQASVAKKARQVGPMDAFCTPKVVALQSGKQSTINEAYRKEQREKAAADVARWLYDAGIPFNALNYPSFKVAMDSVARAGIGQKPLSAYEARVPFLRKEVQRTNDLMKIHREEWARTGCSIMSDGWEDRCHRSILNFLVNCSKGSMFIESVDASSYSKTGDRLYMLLSRIIEKVGEHNVVQVITDNGSNFVAAGALLEAKYPHLYWTPCAAHCIDLMLEDISKISAIDRVLKRAIHMTSFIYQRPNLINLMRRFSGQRNLLRPAKTRFATAFITLSSIHKQRDNLRKLFTSQEWVTSKWAKELGGKRASQTVLMPTFWNGLVYALKLTGPLVHTLRLVDGERKPAMGYIYEAMDRTKEIIASTFNGNESKYIDVFQIIDNRWECQLHRPLHAAGHFLNPEFFYNNPQLEQCEEVVSGLYQCIQRLVPIIAKQDKIMEELTAYKNADGLFGNPMAIRHRKTKAPAEWWAAYGSSTPTLQQFAVKILSLTCSSSGCERNWSIFEHIHTKKRNRLAQSRLNDLVYVKYNRALIQRYQLKDKIDPISLKDIDESNEWLTGRIESDEEGAENEMVFEDDNLNWGTVAAAAGVDEERFNLRFGASGGSSSSSQRHMSRQEIEEEEVEDDDEGYGSESESDSLEDNEDLIIEDDVF